MSNNTINSEFVSCPCCRGTGNGYNIPGSFRDGIIGMVICSRCNGTGQIKEVDVDKMNNAHNGDGDVERTPEECISIIDIVGDWLKSHHYDGLVCDFCGCDFSCLLECGDINNNCQPAYKLNCDDCDARDECDEFEPCGFCMNGNGE